MYSNTLKKKDRAGLLIRENQKLFKCPVCGEKMAMNDSGSLICDSRHCFDLSKNGYLNLLVSANKASYSKELFEARHILCENGFYDPLIDEINKIIYRYVESIDAKELTIVDAGCGEGSHLYKLSQKDRRDIAYSLFGIDISKDSINIAARSQSDIIWCVADLARLPFTDESFDVILNILSPANYAEFTRIVTDLGIVIKVVPGRLYLKELRDAIYRGREGGSYSNDKVVDYFMKNLKVVSVQDVMYEFSFDKGLLPHLINMTPLTWGERIDNLQIMEEDVSSITVDLTIIVGRKS